MNATTRAGPRQRKNDLFIKHNIIVVRVGVGAKDN